jgi:hypothetical protein
MKRVLTIIAALLVAAAPSFAANQYGWTISSSPSDPFVNTGPVTGAPLSLYLWLACSDNGGMSAAEFDLQTPPGVFNFGFTVLGSFLNAGGATHLLLAVGGCPTGPVPAGLWNVFNTTPGSYCLVNGPGGGNRGTVDCDPVAPQLWPIGVVGYGAGGPPSCVELLCPIVSVESSSWGSVKSLYR